MVFCGPTFVRCFYTEGQNRVINATAYRSENYMGKSGCICSPPWKWSQNMTRKVDCCYHFTGRTERVIWRSLHSWQQILNLRKRRSWKIENSHFTAVKVKKKLFRKARIYKDVWGREGTNTSLIYLFTHLFIFYLNLLRFKIYPTGSNK